VAGSAAVTVGCLTCQVRQEIVLADVAAGEDSARVFFTRHGDCLTSIDVPSYSWFAEALAHAS
jgi:hypothetical protein